MSSRWTIVLCFITLLGLTLGVARGAVRVFAQTGAEPTKAPYIFPTPVFIPTYANDTPQPPAPTRNASTPGASALNDPTGSELTYTVQPGDSLWIIAQKVYGNGAKYPLIANANNLTATTRLKNGMVLKIPAAAGVQLPTPASPPRTPVIAAPTLAPTQIATPMTAAPTPTPTPAGALPGSLTEAAHTAINIVSAILFLASIFSGALAYLAFARAQRLGQAGNGKPPLRLR